MSFFNELKRRNVFKVGVAYAVASWLLLQIVDLVLENIHAPDWIMQVFMLAMAVGFPIAIIIAWAFEVTPDGVKLERNVDRSQSIATQTGQHLNRGIIMILVVAVVFLMTERFRGDVASEPEDVSSSASSEELSTSVDEPSNVSIAVLPFRDMSSAQDQAYFGEGIAEELLNALVKVDGLDVASRTSAFSIVDENLDIPAIAAKLGVAHILEGSIRTSGQKVRVTAQLIEVSNDVHLWSETYDGSLDDIFKIQDEITAKIIAAMEIQLGGKTIVATSTELTDNPEAYQMYLQGRHLWRQRSIDSLKKAIRLFEQAVQLDPNFQRAWSNLAVAYLNLPSYDGSVDSKAFTNLAEDAANQALEINPNNSEALAVMADIAFDTCENVTGTRLLEKAIAANPTDPTAHHWYAIRLGEYGKMKKALEEIQTATRIDPLISAVIASEAYIQIAMGNYLQAEELAQKAAALGYEDGSRYTVTLMQALSGNFTNLEDLYSKDKVQHKTLLKLFAQAIQDKTRVQALEDYVSAQPKADFFTARLNSELLTAVGSHYVIDYMTDHQCGIFTESVWSEAFREPRGTSEFFRLMERQGIVDYWHEFGWPDDCASLDQSLAECP